jgi:NtrC-family two-component system sensor histidine kinase KinB
MSLRMKLTIGLGFLFIIIFALAIYSSLKIQELSRDADNILKDNYASLVYCKNMLLALDDISTTVTTRIFSKDKVASYALNLFESSKSTFDSNLNAEKSNITEVHERDYVAELDHNYSLLLTLYSQIDEKGGSPSLYFNDFIPTYSNARQAIIQINDLNMQAVERKSQSTKHDAALMTISMGVVGTVCILLAFFYFWYFPFYVSYSISYLATRMKGLLQDTGIKIDTKTNDETLILLHSIDLLDNKFSKEKRTRKKE